MNEIDKARKFMTDAEAKLKDHDKMFANQYAKTDELIERVSKLERQLSELLRKP
jgi:hypothetical protein